MMQIQKNTTNRKRVIIIASAVAILVLAVGGYFAYAYFTSTDTSKDSGVNYDEATKDQKDAGNATKEKSIKPADDSKPNSGSDQAESPVPQADGKGKVNATMTSANQNGSIVQIRFNLGAVTGTGTCQLTLKKGSATVTKTAEVQALAGSSTCKGFDIPVDELSLGTWQIALHFENDSLIADTTGTVEVQ